MPWMWMYKRMARGGLNNTGYLCRVIETGKVDRLKFLLDLGANPNWCTIYGTTLLIYAVQENQAKIVQLLLDRGADVNTKIWRSPPVRGYSFDSFYYAHYLVEGDVVTRLLLTSGVHLTEAHIHKGIHFRSLETIRVLVENLTPATFMGKESYKDWNFSLLHELTEREGRDALDLALSFNLPEEILNARSPSGRTALHEALVNDKFRHLASTLISTCGIDLGLKTDLGLKNICGATALHIALERQEWDLAHEIIKAGCQLNVIVLHYGLFHWNELHISIAKNAPVDIISSLLTGGAGIS